jgi:addiction module HigA family antidote
MVKNQNKHRGSSLEDFLADQGILEETKAVAIAEVERMLSRTSPGELLREDTLPFMGMTVAEFADDLGVPESQIADVVVERAAVMPDLADRLGR